MKLFGVLIKQGSTVIEVGGHIGFISMYFAQLVGPNGKVYVFEPGSNNQPYIRENIESGMPPGKGGKITLIPKAVGYENGEATLYEDSLTGQNNSLVKNFQGLRNNIQFSYVESEVKEKTVPVVSIDSFLMNNSVDFIKIDVEGFEFSVLRGATHAIQNNLPVVMVEVQANEKEIFHYFSTKNYVMYNDRCEKLMNYNSLKGNIFCIHQLKHQSFLEKISAS